MVSVGGGSLYKDPWAGQIGVSEDLKKAECIKLKWSVPGRQGC